MKEQMTLNKQSSSPLGFTLAEVLIALALLGIIAAFTIPKIMQTVDTKQRALIMQETIIAIETAFKNKQTDGLDTSQSLAQNLANAMNTVAAGGTRAQVPAEILNLPYIGGNSSVDGYLILPSGAMLVTLTKGLPVTTAAEAYQLFIDYNGPKGPNIMGQDVFVGSYSYGGIWLGFNFNTRTFEGETYSFAAIEAMVAVAGPSALERNYKKFSWYETWDFSPTVCMAIPVMKERCKDHSYLQEKEW